MFVQSVVFFSGAMVMSFEILGSRVLAPFFGSSIFVWGSLISIFLAGLSVGYYGGGKAADIRPSSRMLGLVVLFPALWFLLFPFFQKAVLSWIFDADLGERLGPLLAALVLFLVPAAFLGAVSPYIVKMRLYQSSKDRGNRWFSLRPGDDRESGGDPVDFFLPYYPGRGRSPDCPGGVVAVSAFHSAYNTEIESQAFKSSDRLGLQDRVGLS